MQPVSEHVAGAHLPHNFFVYTGPPEPRITHEIDRMKHAQEQADPGLTRHTTGCYHCSAVQCGSCRGVCCRFHKPQRCTHPANQQQQRHDARRETLCETSTRPSSPMGGAQMLRDHSSNAVVAQRLRFSVPSSVGKGLFPSLIVSPVGMLDAAGTRVLYLPRTFSALCPAPPESV